VLEAVFAPVAFALIVVGVLVWALARRRRRSDTPGKHNEGVSSERSERDKARRYG
jgi:hypothetical protein